MKFDPNKPVPLHKQLGGQGYKKGGGITKSPVVPDKVVTAQKKSGGGVKKGSKC